jgi:KDO2-lipid IV(A) lauroyltransferase
MTSDAIVDSKLSAMGTGHDGAAAKPRRASVRGRLAVRLLSIAALVLRHLPDRALHRAADQSGRALYLVRPARRRLVRENLRRVCTYLAQQGLGGERVAAAARDPRRLEALVRDAFGHYVRGYLEGLILPVYGTARGLDRVKPDDPGVADAAFGPARGGRPLIILGLHFGAIEISALWATRRAGLRITAPMESVGDPAIQSYFARTRGATGLTVIPLDGAATTLRKALDGGTAVALVGDRPVGGSGTPVTLFGAPARLPVGPAVLALETGAPVWLSATRRVGWGEYRGRLERVDMPGEGSRRQRLNAFLDAQARAFERAIADAPEQWWTVFFPIWQGPAR